MMGPADPAPERLSTDAAAALAEFARACKGAARAVSLYPATHPAIQGALSRVVAASARLAAQGSVTLTVLPDSLAIDGRTAARPDPAIAELADLLHARLVGTLTIQREADAQDWHALLVRLGRQPEELIADGGLARSWAAAGRGGFEIREIDYAEVLRERSGGERADWDRIIASCLQGDGGTLDDAAIDTLLELAGDAGRFGDFLDRLQDSSGGDARVGARAAALLRIIRGLLDRLQEQSSGAGEALLDTVAAAASRLTPEMMMTLLSRAREGGTAEHGDVVHNIVERMNDSTVAGFVAGSIVSERGATGRLAQAFQALVPDPDRKQQLLELAREEVAQSPLGQESGFEELWQNASSMLLSYSDEPFVSADYARELSGARTQAVEVERVSDDPPERVQAWLATVHETAVRRLDVQLLLDLLRIENDPGQWRSLADVVRADVERLVLLGEAADAQALLEAVVRETGPDAREGLRPAAAAVIDTLASGALVRHIVLHLRKVEEREVQPFARLCHTMGPIVIKPLAEAIAVEENSKALRRLREVLLGFGAAGRRSVEQLKLSANPAVRRTAIDLLRVFGGSEALPELASMLDDADPQVQRESIRAIVQIGTEEAYAVLERALVGGDARSRDTILQQLIGLRDDKAVPLLCYVLTHTTPRGRLVNVHLGIIDALGGLGAHPQSTRTLKQVLHGGQWWAPFRTAALRKAAATALRRIGSPEARAVLEEAASNGSRGVRNAVRTQVGAARAARERMGS